MNNLSHFILHGKDAACLPIAYKQLVVPRGELMLCSPKSVIIACISRKRGHASVLQACFVNPAAVIDVKRVPDPDALFHGYGQSVIGEREPSVLSDAGHGIRKPTQNKQDDEPGYMLPCCMRQADPSFGMPFTMVN